jgi:hypothetical protein
VGHADDVDATSGRRQCREIDTRHPWGWEYEGRRPGECLSPGAPAARGLVPSGEAADVCAVPRRNGSAVTAVGIAARMTRHPQRGDRAPDD